MIGAIPHSPEGIRRFSCAVDSMARLLLLLAALSVAFLSAAAWAANGDGLFAAGVEDLPLMPGLREEPDSGLVFDKPEGRIVEIFATGPVERYTVARFYHRVLPELGWVRRGQLLFERNGEILRIEPTGRDGDLRIRFSIKPR